MAAGDILILPTPADGVIREVNAVTHVITTVAGQWDQPDLVAMAGRPRPLSLDDPTGIAVDAAGDIFIADDRNDVVREVNAVTHIITTVAGNGVGGFSGDGGQATAAALNGPMGPGGGQLRRSVHRRFRQLSHSRSHGRRDPDRRGKRQLRFQQ